MDATDFINDVVAKNLSEEAVRYRDQKKADQGRMIAFLFSHRCTLALSSVVRPYYLQGLCLTNLDCSSCGFLIFNHGYSGLTRPDVSFKYAHLQKYLPLKRMF